MNPLKFTKKLFRALDTKSHSDCASQRCCFGVRLYVGVGVGVGIQMSLAHIAAVKAANIHSRYPLFDLPHGHWRHTHDISVQASRKSLNSDKVSDA